MPLFAGNKHILNAAATMNPTGERVNMAAVLIVPAFFIFSCSLHALYESMILILKLTKLIIYQRAFHFSTFSHLVWLRIQVLTFTHPSFIHDNSSIFSWSEHAGNQSAPLGFLTKKQEPTVASCKTKTPRKRIRNCFIQPLLKTSV